MKYVKRTHLLRIVLLCLLFSPMSQTQAPTGVPTFQIDQPPDSKVTFSVKASVPIEGVFDKWDATVKFTSTDLTTGVLDIKVDADSVNTGSGMKNDKLKGKDFFDAKNDPYITFHSEKPKQSGPTTIEFPGTFTIRGVSKPETLVMTLLSRPGAAVGAVGEVKGTMAFDRKDYGMNSGIPFIKIADRVEVDVDLKGKRVSGPPLDLKQ
jgi:polyisoprenoid-binding protein YceI